MSAEQQDESPVNRLTDIVVEEVSLVDRAANKHRFLIVKRRDDVDDSTTETETDQTADESVGEAEPVEDGATGDDVADVDTAEADDDAADDEAETTAPIAAVADALERLTDAVELLGTLDEAEAKARITELAGELRRLTEQLTGQSGDAPESVDEADATDEAAVPSETNAIDERPTDPEIHVEEPAQPSTELREQIQALAEELRILVGTVKEQQQRISRLEKRSGLPNSTPPGERRRVTKDEADVSWPFDLNRDRGSDHVDQSISFHDE